MYLSGHALYTHVVFLFLLSTLCQGDGIGTLMTYTGNTCTTTNGTFYGSQLSLCQHITDSSGFYYVTHQFQITNNICAVTVYSDMYCSDDGAVINANTCTHSSVGIQSWSVDCSPGDAGYSSSAKSGSTPSSTADAAPATLPATSNTATSHTSLTTIVSVVPSTVTSATLSSATSATAQSANSPTATISLASANSPSTPTATPQPSPINTSLIGQIVGPVLGVLSSLIGLVIYLMKRRDKKRKKATEAGSEHGEVNLLGRPPYTDDDEATRTQMKSLATTNDNDVR